MKSFRVLLTIGTLFALSASTLSAQGGRVDCMDGSRSVGGRGACSGHGGIMTAQKRAELKAASDARKAEAKAAKADKKAARAETKADARLAKSEETDAHGATAECKDHTYSHATTHQGACSRHGGVARFFDAR